MSEEQVSYRISKSTRRHMVAVGILFDLLPVAALIAAAALVFYGISSLGTECIKAAGAGISGYVWHGAQCVIQVGVKITAAIAAALTMITLGPLILAIASVLSNVLFAGVFTIWFMAHGVFMWAATPKRFLTNFATFIVKFFPVLNILIPACTTAVLLHIKATREEDERKAKDAAAQKPRQYRDDEDMVDNPVMAPA